MNFFDGLILNTILLMFPLFLYLIYISYKKKLNKDEANLILEAALFLSLFLISRYGEFNNNSYVSILVNVPLLFAYLKGRKLVGGIISIILGLYYVVIFDYPPYLVILEYLSYFLLYIYSNHRSITSSYIINGFTIIKSFFISFATFYLINPQGSITLNLFNIIISLTTFHIMSILYYHLIRKIEDMTILNSTLKELEKEKTIRTSLFKITHEIKNPIAVCKGYLDMLDLNNKHKLDKYIPIIKSEINRTLTLMDDYLDYSKIKIEKDIIDVILLIEETSRSMDVLMKDNNIRTIYEIDDTEVYLLADYNRLKQVLVNLLKNSMEAKMKDRDLLIKMQTEISKRDIKIIISDNGEGMTEEELQQLGEVFYTTKSHGSGIGVNLSKEIIERHNGTLEYESSKYIGTKVTITLPIDPELNNLA